MGFKFLAQRKFTLKWCQDHSSANKAKTCLAPTFLKIL